MAPHRLTTADARHIAVRAQLLDAERPTDLLDVVEVGAEVEALATWLGLEPSWA